MHAFAILQTLFVLQVSLCGWFTQTANAAPIPRNLRKRAGLSAPYFVVYNDIGAPGEVGPPPAAAVAGFNVVALSFILGSGVAVDKAKEWESMSDGQRSAIKADYASQGIKLIVSAFGATETPTTSGSDPVQLAHTISAWVKANNVDGVDVDYEDLAAFNAKDGKAEDWVITFTQTLRADLPQGEYILSHAPLAPWFSSAFDAGGGYKKINTAVGSSIDFYAMQFYNQGAAEYTTCDSLLHKSTAFPAASVFEIAAAGVDLSKIVIGKPATAADANNGFMDTGLLASCLQEAKAAGWNGGAMTWQYPHGNAAWIASVKALAWGGSADTNVPVSMPAPESSSTEAVIPTPTDVAVPTNTDAAVPTDTVAVAPTDTDAAAPTDTDAAVPTDASATPTVAEPTDATPTDATLTDATPTDAKPTDTAVPTDAVTLTKGGLAPTSTQEPAEMPTSATFNDGKWTPPAAEPTAPVWRRRSLRKIRRTFPGEKL